MTIKVKLSDGNAEVGGEFNRALSFVKGFAGRKYDAATKTWAIPMTLAAFLKASESASLPTEYSGAAYPTGRRESGHQTRYGNRYSDTEWQATNEGRKAASVAAQALQGQVEAAEKALREAQMQILLNATDGNIQVSERLYRMFVSVQAPCGQISVEEAEAEGIIQFSSPARRQAVIEAVEAARDDRLYKPLLQAYRDQEDAEGRAEREVYEKYGVFN